MEEDLKALIEELHPGEELPGLDRLRLTYKYIHVPGSKIIRLHYRLLKDLERPARASICMVHGFAEHSAKLLYLAYFFAVSGFEVHLIDLRSYGCSGGARCGGNLVDFQTDVKLLLEQARSDLPCFLFGHSMGGLIVSTILINNPQLNFSGVIISAPLYETSSAEMDPVKERALSLLQEGLKDGVFNSYIAAGCTTNDDLYLKGLFNDRKMMPFYGIELGVSLLDHMKGVRKYASRIKHPVVFYHGDNDVLTYAKTTREVFNKASSLDKTFNLVKGGYHEPHHDIDRKSYIKGMIDWVNDRTKGKPFGKVCNFKSGLPGLPGPGYWKKVLFYVLVLLYFGVAYKIKITINLEKVMKIGKAISAVIWPLRLII